MDRPTDALRGSVRGRHVDLCRMSCVWVPSMSAALVGPHASMPDDVRLSGRVFCVSDLRALAATYRQTVASSAAAGLPLCEPLEELITGGLIPVPGMHRSPRLLPHPRRLLV
eukprot:2532026-Prymnesium_polylepis.1